VTATFAYRWATTTDLSAIEHVMRLSMAQLMDAFLTPAQVAASDALMGLDRQLVEDGTYLLALDGATLVGCGGWSRRATPYGGSHSRGRDGRMLDPATEPARIRAMYTHPDHIRRGIGRGILDRCEAAAVAAGFRAAMLVATMPGLPLYTACGYAVAERFEDTSGGTPVPLARMTKTIA